MGCQKWLDTVIEMEKYRPGMRIETKTKITKLNKIRCFFGIHDLEEKTYPGDGKSELKLWQCKRCGVIEYYIFIIKGIIDKEARQKMNLKVKSMAAGIDVEWS